MSSTHTIVKIIYFSILFLTIMKISETKIYHRNNACKTYIDYFFIDISENCFYYPEIFQQPIEIIERHVGFSETYNVTTEDGYILTIFRIPPRKKAKGVIILQHPVTTDSIVWVGQSNQSFAFLLWNLGYDIWLPNHRGTFFSRKHVSLDTRSRQYWDFSFHEIGFYDYKTIIDFIKAKTNNNEIIFIAHSMSTTSSLIYASLRPEEALSSVKIFIEMSPICYLKHVTSPVKYFSYFTPLIKTINDFFHKTHLQEYDSKSMQFLRLLMLFFPFKYILVMFISLLQGWNPQEIDPTLVNLMISYHPRSYPWKLFYHYVQIYKSGRFQNYDYGRKMNTKIYKTGIPPEYPIEKIKTPIFLVYGDEDSLATPKDVEYLFGKLSHEAKIYGKLRVSGINHVDFHYGKHRKDKIFNKIVQLLDKLCK